ncbi:hypothetical protein BU17DRAFT_68804 [Hysterangium stoloniferum]|nr:hypothetical protein BU17DRAFT_68804 [Hysterangium stoloniferum]
MVDDEDEGSKSESEADGDADVPEIHKISALEHFAFTLQQAHDAALAAEQEWEKGRKTPQTYKGNSDRTKWQCHRMHHDLETKGFHSVKDWLLQTRPISPSMPELSVSHHPELGPSDFWDFQESEESGSEDEI